MNNFNQKTRLSDDSDETYAKDRNNELMSKYNLTGYNLNGGFDNCLAQNGILVDRCSDFRADSIDNESAIWRGMQTQKGGKDPSRENTRVFAGPNKSLGQTAYTNPDQQCGQRPAMTRQPRTENSIDRFIPLVPKIANEIQNPDHYVPTAWVRGGMDTRTIQRNIDYAKSCGLKR